MPPEGHGTFTDLIFENKNVIDAIICLSTLLHKGNCFLYLHSKSFVDAALVQSSERATGIEIPSFKAVKGDVKDGWVVIKCALGSITLSQENEGFGRARIMLFLP